MANNGNTTQSERVIERIRKKLQQSGDIDYTFRRPSYFTFQTPIEVHVYGYDLVALQSYASQLSLAMGELRGFRDVRSTLEEGSPEVQIAFRRDRMAALDLDLATVSQTLRNKIRGDVATRLKERDRQIDILVRSAHAEDLEVSKVSELVISQVDGIPIPLSTVADITIGRGPSQITHIGQQRAAVIRANLADRDLGSATRDVEALIETYPPPGTMEVELGGQNREVATSFRSLLLATSLAVFMVYLVMASQFESFLHPFVILLSVPLGMIGVIFALLVTGTDVSIVVLIGAVMLTGIVVNNAIVLIDYINQRRRAGLAKLAAVREGAQTRLRPILMTTLTTVLGLLPMAIGFGEGAEIRAPMAIAVIGGLMLSTLLTLVVIPVVYVSLDRKP
ncbi:MAG: efflux RND transporter permease subunit [Gemmatimonadetes bacterium]|nr:efflux RND transporter permease subunit [Gemmatimonadota bacterium]